MRSLRDGLPVHHFMSVAYLPPRLLRRVVFTIDRIRKNNVGINFRISDGKIWESLILSSEKMDLENCAKAG